MAVRIVNTIPPPEVIRRTVHAKCGATLEYVLNDVQSRTTKDISGCSDTDYFIYCPNCGQNATVKNY